jgi:uncharacterized membrane protein
MEAWGRLRLLALWDSVQSSLWFVPALLMVAAVCLASTFVAIDSFIDPDGVKGGWPLFFGAGAAGSRGMLSAIATSMITLAGVAFSITIVVLSLASSQYSPRILRNFMRDRTNQTVLGVLVGIYVYCLLVLRSIRGGDEGAFVPAIAVLFAIVLALAGIASFIYFIHHIAYSIQAESIIKSAADETSHTIDRLFPTEAPDSADADMHAAECSRLQGVALDDRCWKILFARKTGFLQRIDYETLLDVARTHRMIVRVKLHVGDFVIEHAPLAEWSMDEEEECQSQATSLMADLLSDRFHIGRTRAMVQDPGFGIRQIVDIALRALSSGVNDTTTAVTCVNYLSALIARIAPKAIPSAYILGEGRLRIIKRVPDFERMVADAFDHIRQNAQGNSAVLTALLNGLETIHARTCDPTRRRALERQAEAIAAVSRTSGLLPADCVDMDDTICRILGQRPHSFS